MNEVVSYDAKWAEMAEQWQTEERLTGGTFLSTRGGILKFGEDEMPGNQVAVIVLDSIRENTYYDAAFDEGTPQAPICYAFGRGVDADETMAPDPSMQKGPEYFTPQSDQCKTCKHNEWGSADKGRSKTCQNRRRLALIPAGMYTPKRGSRDFDLDLFTDVKHYQQAEIAYLKLPVMSVKEWSKYVVQVGAQLQRPPMGVITRLYLAPHPKAQYQVLFEVVDPLPNELSATVLARVAEAQQNIAQGYRPPVTEAAPNGSLRGVAGRR